MIIQIAVADAYGAAFEFAANPPPNDLQYHAHPSRSDDIKIGEYTDDTQMSIAIMRHMESRKVCNQYWIAKYFLDEFKKYPIDGYARSFQKLLASCDSVEEFLSQIAPNSNRNGSVMRSVPVGVLPTVEEVVKYSYVQSSVTHATMPGCLSAAAVALSAHYFYHNVGPDNQLPFFLRLSIGFSLQNVDTSVACDAVETAHAAINIAKDTKCCATAMQRAAQLNGDVDSVAAVAVGLISLKTQFVSVPEYLIDQLSDRSRRNVASLISLEKKFFKGYPRNQMK